MIAIQISELAGPRNERLSDDTSHRRVRGWPGLASTQRAQVVSPETCGAPSPTLS